MTPKKLFAISIIANAGIIALLIWVAVLIKNRVAKQMDERCNLGLSLQTTKRDSTQYVLDHSSCIGR